jgi:hypothetical protein
LGQSQELGLVLRAEHLNDVSVYNLTWSFRIHRHPPTDSRPLVPDSRLVWFIPDFSNFFQIAALSALRHAKGCALTKIGTRSTPVIVPWMNASKKLRCL